MRLLSTACLKPQSLQWFDISSDRWCAELKDICPGCRALKITEDDAILLDGLVGATIFWDRIPDRGRLDVLTDSAFGGLFWSLQLGVFGLHAALWYLAVKRLYIVGCRYGTYYGATPPAWLVKLWAALLIVAIFLAPFVFLFSRRSLLKDSNHSKSGNFFRPPPKAQLVGIEGRADAMAVERYLWGANWRRLSAVDSDHDDFLDGKDRTVEAEQPLRTRRLHTFTLINTQELSVTYFRSSSTVHSQMPPVSRARLSCDPQLADSSAEEARDPGPDMNAPEGSHISLTNASSPYGQQSASSKTVTAWSAHFAFVVLVIVCAQVFLALT